MWLRRPLKASSVPFRLKFQNWHNGNSGLLNIAVGVSIQSSDGFVNFISDVQKVYPNISLNFELCCIWYLTCDIRSTTLSNTFYYFEVVRKLSLTYLRLLLHFTKCKEDKSSHIGFPRLLTVVPINIDQNEPLDTKKKKIYR